MAGGSRNTPIYHLMAQQINESTSSARSMTAVKVKTKICNLVCEYREKKKDQGKSGASPSSWRYFDQIDKLLGARPYNDDTLLSDTMLLQDEEQLEEIPNVPSAHLNPQSNFDENSGVISKPAEGISRDGEPSTSASPTSSASIQKNKLSCTPDASIRKGNLSKKKKSADARLELMEKMLVKIDGANEAANKAESTALVLLEKQTQLQEESVNNEKEFLKMFRSIANNMTSTD